MQQVPNRQYCSGVRGAQDEPPTKGIATLAGKEREEDAVDDDQHIEDVSSAALSQILTR